MPIDFVVVKNKLPGNEERYRAMVRPFRTIGEEEVIARMLELGTTVSRADIMGTMEVQAVAIVSLVLEGYNVNTELANYGVAIQGNFDTAEDTFDPQRHHIVARVGPGRRLRRAVRQRAEVSRDFLQPAAPILLSYRDVRSDSVDSLATPGGMGYLYGKALTFDPADPRQGIFFVSITGETIAVKEIGPRKPSELFFLVPPLLQGEYWLEVRALPYGRGEDIRAGRLERRLTVIL